MTVDLTDDDAVRREIARELLRKKGFGHVGEVWDRRYEEDRKKHKKPVRETCELCGWPIALTRPWRACEFGYQPGVWWRGDTWEFCRCNGCLCPPVGSMGRPKYCGDGCRDRIDAAQERQRRRAAGAVSRSFDADADRLVDYRAGIGRRAQQAVELPPSNLSVTKCEHCLSARFAPCGRSCAFHRSIVT